MLCNVAHNDSNKYEPIITLQAREMNNQDAVNRKTTPAERLNRCIISKGTQNSLPPLNEFTTKSVRRLKPCCAKTMMERTKVRQATVFLAKQPRETKVNKKKSNEF